MSRLIFTLSIGIALALTACAQATTARPGLPTPVALTASAGTALSGTAEPVFSTAVPPGYTPPPAKTPPTVTALPTLPGGLGSTELKYRILADFPDFFFCDPDFYPVAREDELELARQRFPELQANPEEFNVILVHMNLAGVETFTDEQKLLIYQEHKKLAAISLAPTGGSYQFQIQTAKTKGEGELVSGLIDGQGSITVVQRTASFPTCPICLAAGVLIDTPRGPQPVESLRPRMLVWTMDEAGKRTAQPLVKTGKTSVPPDHLVVHLVLDDGRELRVSAGHPTADGRSIGQLQAGDALDGGKVLSIERVVYTGAATYDLLPAGETGYYWANGILLASTLQPADSAN